MAEEMNMPSKPKESSKTPLKVLLLRGGAYLTQFVYAAIWICWPHAIPSWAVLLGGVAVVSMFCSAFILHMRDVRAGEHINSFMHDHLWLGVGGIVVFCCSFAVLLSFLVLHPRRADSAQVPPKHPSTEIISVLGTKIPVDDPHSKPAISPVQPSMTPNPCTSVEVSGNTTRNITGDVAHIVGPCPSVVYRNNVTDGGRNGLEVTDTQKRRGNKAKAPTVEQKQTAVAGGDVTQTQATGGGVIQKMTNSPGGMQAGRDLNVYGKVDPPDRVLIPNDVQKAVELLKQAPSGAQVFFITYPTQVASTSEISRFSNQLQMVFGQAGWIAYRERNFQIGSISQVTDNGISAGEGIGCAMSAPPTGASEIGYRAMALLHYPCAHPSVVGPYDVPNKAFKLFISVGTRLDARQ